MKNQVLLILCGLLAGFSSFAQQNNNSPFSLQIAYDSVGLDEQFEIKYTLDNIKAIGQFQAPVLEGFQVLAGPMTSQNMSIINGNMTQSISYTYIVKANDLGIYTIPAASIETEEGFLMTKEKAIVVVQEINRPQLNSPFNAFQDPFFSDPFSDPFFNQGSQGRMDDMMKQFDEMFRLQPPIQLGPNGPNQSPKKKPKKKEKVYKI